MEKDAAPNTIGFTSGHPAIPIFLANMTGRRHGATGGMIVKYRDIDYGIDEAAPSKWRWIIYPKIEVHPKVIGEELFDSRDAAIAACIAKINSRLDQKTQTPRA